MSGTDAQSAADDSGSKADTPSHFRSRQQLRKVRPSHRVDQKNGIVGIDWEAVERQTAHQEKRTPFQKDLDNVLYSYYSRRLAQITQVSSSSLANGPIIRTRTVPHAITHNRLTHSFKVGQVARRLVQYLKMDANNDAGIKIAGGIDPDVAELAGRAHDLGHPPFGHCGEVILDEVARSWGLRDGFEGNAQTFRILTFLQRKLRANRPIQGLDLTMASTASVVKYPWARGRNPDGKEKFNYYYVDQQRFDLYAKPLLYADGVGTLEAQIMDWADDISYAAHDVEDYALLGEIPIHRLMVINGSPADPDEFHRFWTYAEEQLKLDKDDLNEVRRHFEAVAGTFFLTRLNDSEYSRLIMTTFVSTIITNTSMATVVNPETGRLEVTAAARRLVYVLKLLTSFYVINTPQMHAQQAKDGRILRAVSQELHRLAIEAFSAVSFERFLAEDWDRGSTSMSKLSIPFRETIERAARDSLLCSNPCYRLLSEAERYQLGISRGVIDHIASLTEDAVYDLYSTHGLDALQR